MKSAPPFTSRYPGTCHACGQCYPAGTPITRHITHGWVHLTCPPAGTSPAVVLPAPRRDRYAGTLRPHGPGGICTACGDDCGGSPWRCGYQ